MLRRRHQRELAIVEARSRELALRDVAVAPSNAMTVPLPLAPINAHSEYTSVRLAVATGSSSAATIPPPPPADDGNYAAWPLSSDGSSASGGGGGGGGSGVGSEYTRINVAGDSAYLKVSGYVVAAAVAMHIISLATALQGEDALRKAKKRRDKDQGRCCSRGAVQ